MSTEAAKETVWVVSFRVKEDGSLDEYTIDEWNLTDCSRKVADALRAKLGRGVFTSLAEAEKWAKGQSGKSCGCGGGGAGCGGCGCQGH